MAPSKRKLEKKIPMEFIRSELKLLNNDVVATYEQKKSADLASAHRCLPLPKVRLDLKEKHDVYQFEVMHRIRHASILRLEAIQEIQVTDKSLIAVFVEPHCGPLIACLKKLVFERNPDSIPSQSLRDLVRQMILALEMLRKNGLSHGNVSMENIYYSIEDHVIIIKLVNFRPKPKDTDLEAEQLLDWNGLGDVIGYISNAAKDLNMNVSFSLIDHLALKLQRLNDPKSLANLKDEILDVPFFWSPRKRATFYMHDLQKALKDDAIFTARVRNYAHWQLPWDSNCHDGLIPAMNKHRREVLLMAEYNGNDPVANVNCMVGAYTHPDKLEGKIIDAEGAQISVDTTIQKNQPDLCLTLYRLLKGEIAAEEAAAAAAGAGDDVMNEDVAMAH